MSPCLFVFNQTLPTVNDSGRRHAKDRSAKLLPRVTLMPWAATAGAVCATPIATHESGGPFARTRPTRQRSPSSIVDTSSV